MAPFSGASPEDGNFLLVLLVRLTEIIAREWRLLTGPPLGAPNRAPSPPSGTVEGAAAGARGGAVPG